MQFKYKCLLLISPLVLVLDQLTKFLVVKKIPFGSGFSVVAGFLDMVHFNNTGAAFGMLSGADPSLRVPFFYAISALALIAIAAYIYKMPSDERIMPFALSLVVGGIFGNGIDRIRHGAVTDFISVHIGDKVLLGMRLEWPAFNVADISITVAMFLLVISAFRTGKNKK